jgi:hypothetical protein
MPAGKETEETAGASSDEEDSAEGEAAARTGAATSPRPDLEAAEEGASELGAADLDLLESLNLNGTDAPHADICQRIPRFLE